MLLACAAASAQNAPVRFQAEASAGQEFRRDLGRGLTFVLKPDESGWTITVTPAGPAGQGCDDFVWVVTPPYRSYNQRYLEASYGTTAAEAVKMSPREFQFVLNATDCKREGERVDRVLWPYNYTDDQVKKAEAKLGSSPLGKGRLTILDSKTSPSGELVEGKDFGKIDWIKFAVEIRFPAAPK